MYTYTTCFFVKLIHIVFQKKIPTTLSENIIIKYESTYYLVFFILLNSTCKYIEIDSIFKTFTTILPVLFFLKRIVIIECHVTSNWCYLLQFSLKKKTWLLLHIFTPRDDMLLFHSEILKSKNKCRWNFEIPALLLCKSKMVRGYRTQKCIFVKKKYRSFIVFWGFQRTAHYFFPF